jgi:hypothetical protein
LFELTLLPRRKRWDKLCKKGEWLEGDRGESAEECARGEADGGTTVGSEAIGTVTAAATVNDWMGLILTQNPRAGLVVLALFLSSVRDAVAVRQGVLRGTTASEE